MLLLGLALSLALPLGCGREGSPNGAKPVAAHGGEPEGVTSSSPSHGGTRVGGMVAEAELEPVSNFDTGGTAVFREVGSTDVQVELNVSGLPTSDPGATYFAQVHVGSCSDARTGEDHGHEGLEREEHGAAGPALALLRLDRLMAKVPEYAHGDEEHHIPNEPPGSIEQPVSFGVSADGTTSVVSLLEWVAPKQLRSGSPKYMDLRSAESEDAPVMACGDLRSQGQS